MTRDTRGVPASGPMPKFCDLRGRWRYLNASRESQPATPGTDKRRRVVAQDAGRRPRVRCCSPCPEQPRCSAQQSPERGLRAAARSWTRPGSPRPTARFPSGVPRALSATYWGSALAARRGRGPGLARGRASERLQRSADPKLAKARRAAAAFQVRVDRSSRHRAAEGRQGTWAPF